MRPVWMEAVSNKMIFAGLTIYTPIQIILNIISILAFADILDIAYEPGLHSGGMLIWGLLTLAFLSRFYRNLSDNHMHEEERTEGTDPLFPDSNDQQASASVVSSSPRLWRVLVLLMMLQHLTLVGMSLSYIASGLFYGINAFIFISTTLLFSMLSVYLLIQGDTNRWLLVYGLIYPAFDLLFVLGVTNILVVVLQLGYPMEFVNLAVHTGFILFLYPFYFLFSRSQQNFS